MSALWLGAVLAAGLMGFAIQRGGTCTVAAMDELVNQRRARRLAAMLEAALWVAGSLALAHWAMLPRAAIPMPALSAWTVLGGVLLGWGAWLNRACVFGAVARLGSGEWAYAATPLGYFLGCLSVNPLFRPPMMAMPPAASTLGPALAMAFVVFAGWRIASGQARPGTGAGTGAGARTGARVWSPHNATIVIGLAFVATWMLAGRWAYTDVLADLAAGMRGRPRALALPVLLLVALYAGALAGGLSAGRWRQQRPALAVVARCTLGGMVMAWGSLLIPGSNDGLVLVGLPHGQLHAWLAFAAMCGAIAAALFWQRWRARPA